MGHVVFAGADDAGGFEEGEGDVKGGGGRARGERRRTEGRRARGRGLVDFGVGVSSREDGIDRRWDDAGRRRAAKLDSCSDCPARKAASGCRLLVSLYSDLPCSPVSRRKVKSNVSLSSQTADCKPGENSELLHFVSGKGRGPCSRIGVRQTLKASAALAPATRPSERRRARHDDINPHEAQNAGS